MVLKEHEVVIRISFGSSVHMVTILNNTVYLKFVKRANPKGPHTPPHTHTRRERKKVVSMKVMDMFISLTVVIISQSI